MRAVWKRWNVVRDYALLKVLELIAREPMHGYAILKYLEEELGVKLSPGLLYPVLRRMVDMGLATASGVSIGGKRAIVYDITPTGRKFLEERRSMLEVFEKKALRIKQCRLNELMVKLRYFLVNIEKLRGDDLERLRAAVDRFLEDTKSIGV
ncbi:MAG: PadR family transcriptional regulator [Thermoproteota archaeon]